MHENRGMQIRLAAPDWPQLAALIDRLRKQLEATCTIVARAQVSADEPTVVLHLRRSTQH